MSDAATLQREVFEAVRHRDFDRLRDLCHPDYVYMSGDGVERKGADAVVAICQAYTTAFPDFTLEVRNQFSPSPDVSIMEGTVRGTHQGELHGIPATGRTVEFVFCHVVEVRDGKVHREREYYDGMSIMQQLGAIDAR